MFKFKKTASLALAFACVFGMVQTSFAATPRDVVDTKYVEAVETLKGLGIMVGDEDGSFRPNDPIKRSEMAKISVVLSGLGELGEANTGQTKYPDVPADHWATGYVNTATSQGIIIGDDNGNFRPDEEVSYNDAVTMLVRVLGYQPFADAKGGYPNGFIAAGNYNGLTKGAVSEGTQPVARGIVAQLAYNALTIDLMEQKGFGPNASFEVVDKNILEDKLECEKVTGIVTATSETGLQEKGGLSEDEIKIGDEVYKTEDSKASSYLGYAVTAYAKEDDYSDKNLVMIRKDTNKNRELEITAENMEEVDETTIKYYEDRDNDKKAKEARLSNDADLIFNGVADSMDSLAIPKSGGVKLIDNNNDGKYDLVLLTSSRNIVVEDVAMTSNRIIDKYGNKGLILDPDDDTVKYTLTDSEGNTLELHELEEWNVVQTIESKDGSVIKAIVHDDKIEGKVMAVKGDKKVIGGKEYKVASNYIADINLGDEGVFYLDSENKIAAVNTNATISRNYAYLMNATETGDFEDDKVVQLKLFTLDGKTMTVEGAEKIKFNGESGKSSAEIVAALKSSGKTVKQIITFDKNKDGKVTAINTATDKSGSGLASYKGEFTLNYQKADALYNAASQKLDKIGVNDKTVVFDIPADATDSSDYSIRDYKFFTDNSNYDVKVFDLSEDLTAGVVLVSSTEGATTAEAPVAVVKEVAKAATPDGDEVERLVALYEGKEIEIDTSEEGILVHEDGTELAEGDIIQFRKNAKGEIDKITVLFDMRNKEVEGYDNSVTDLETVYGKVDRKFATSINVKVNDDPAENFSIAGANVYSVDTTKSRNKVMVADASDIQRYDETSPSRVFLRIYKHEVKEVIIVK